MGAKWKICKVPHPGRFTSKTTAPLSFLTANASKTGGCIAEERIVSAGKVAPFHGQL